MADALQVFTHTIADREVTVNALMVNGAPWFCGNDTAAALGYANTRQAINLHVDEDDRAKLKDLGSLETRLPLNHNDSLQTYISESGMYSLIMHSKRPEAKTVQHWVTKVVLPTIRKTGQYTVPMQPTGVSQKRAELEVLEIDERIKSCKRRCIEDGLMSLQKCGLSIDDRDRMRAKDCLNSITFGDLPLEDAKSDKEICIRGFLSERGIHSNAMDSKLGREAKRLYLLDNPKHTFAKKDIYANGQMVQANIWTDAQLPYLERALASITG